MDLCADMLANELTLAGRVELVSHDPRYRQRARGLPFLGERKLAFNADRIFNRYFDYPRQLARLRESCQLFHVVDHSYAQLVQSLPGERTGVFVHDLDCFRSLLEPERDPRPAWYRKLIRSTLRGLTQAALVFHTTDAVRAEILRHALVPEERLVHAPLGVAPEFTPAPTPPPGQAPEPPPESDDQTAVEEGAEEGADEDTEAEQPTPPDAGYLLHVGSCIPRKRVDVLLEVFARLRREYPTLRLIKVGGPWTSEHEALIAREEIATAIEVKRDLSRDELAELYRGARLVLHPSDAEGFGLPVLEALACGAVVVASKIPALEEVGGAAVVFCPPGNVETWTETCRGLLEDPASAPARAGRLHHARRWSWAEHARRITDAYLGLL
ncbi:MAG: glycosyltransferase [Planctomycetes bacterium]|nr:glycosyltransferase [Planctomycetota bacterium]